MQLTNPDDASVTGCSDERSKTRVTNFVINRLDLTVTELDGSSTPLSMEVQAVRGAGLCGRDRNAAVNEQVRRQQAGEPWSSSNQFSYRIGRYLATTADWIEVQGPLTGGEAEAIAIFTGGQILIGLGSDQCDRELDPLFLEKPKQLCPHPLSPEVWRYDDVRDHWDDLQIESEVDVNDYTLSLQRFFLAELVTLEMLLADDVLRVRPDGTIFFCGTGGAIPEAQSEIARLGLPPETIAGVGQVFRMRLCDPVLNREIRHAYRVQVLGDDLADRHPTIYDGLNLKGGDSP